MAETVYSDTRTFESIDGKRVLTVDAGTGSVTVAIRHGASWIDVQSFSVDTAEVIDFGYNRVYRFTVTGDATYAL